MLLLCCFTSKKPDQLSPFDVRRTVLVGRNCRRQRWRRTNGGCGVDGGDGSGGAWFERGFRSSSGSSSRSSSGSSVGSLFARWFHIRINFDSLCFAAGSTAARATLDIFSFYQPPATQDAGKLWSSRGCSCIVSRMHLTARKDILWKGSLAHLGSLGWV